MYNRLLALTHCVYRAAVKEYCRWVQEKIRVRSDNSHLAWGYSPFLGSCMQGHSGVARETHGRRAG